MLTAAVATIAVLVGIISPIGDGGLCTPARASAGLCATTDNLGDHIEVGLSDSRDSNGPRGSEALDSAQSTLTDEPTDACATATVCRDMPYEIISVPDVTIEDLASFRPAAPTLTGEPFGFGVVGLPANVVAAASEQRLNGELLGWDVTVRFRPAGYVFDYGDGTTLRTATGGAAWAAAGQPQFTRTATSHTYRARGTYTASARVLYSAAVDFGSGVWRPVSGYVTAESGAYRIEVLEARTALVDRTCAEDPRGPGC